MKRMANNPAPRTISTGRKLLESEGRPAYSTTAAAATAAASPINQLRVAPDQKTGGLKWSSKLGGSAVDPIIRVPWPCAQKPILRITKRGKSRITRMTHAHMGGV